MRPFLQLIFWVLTGATSVIAGSAIYLFFAIRGVELFPALTSAFVIPGALLLVTVACIAWAQARRNRQPRVETITIDEPFDLREVR